MILLDSLYSYTKKGTMYLKKLGFVKTGSSRLRAVTKVTKWSTSPIKGTKFYGMAVNGKDAGTLQLDSKNRVLTTNIYKEFRGMGVKSDLDFCGILV